MEKVYTVKEVAKLLGVHVQTVYLWIRQGTLPSVRIGPRTLRVTPDALTEFLADKQAAESPGRG